MITGVATLLKGTVLGESTTVDDDKLLDISFTVPLSALDNGSTPYEIADAAATIARARKILDADEFLKLMHSTDTTLSLLDAMLPPLTPDLTVNEQITVDMKKAPGIKKKYPQLLSQFDVDSLTEEQQQSFMLHNASSVYK